MDNFYDMTRVSKNSLEKDKRFHAQAADFLKEYDASLKEEASNKEANELNGMMSSARFSYASSYARSRNRVNSLNEELNYINNASVVGMTEMVSEVIEKALLLDESEFAELNPNYKAEIREIVSGFLTEGKINENITNPETLKLMSYVSNKLPSVREGQDLTEAELSNFLAANAPDDINRSIRDLAGNVSVRVASLMEKEQKKADEIDKDVNRAKGKAVNAEKAEVDPVDEIADAIINGDTTEEEVNELVKQGAISQDQFDAIIGKVENHNPEDDAEAGADVAAQDPNADPNAVNPAMAQEDPNAQMPMDAEQAPQEAMPAEGQMPADAMSQDPNAVDPAMAQAAPTVAPGMPKKQVQMLPDGTMNINIYESDNTLTEANANQVRSNSVIGKKVRSYLQKYGVKMTYRINKHIEACERLFRGDPNDIKLLLVGMPYRTMIGAYGEPVVVNDYTSIIIFTDKDIQVYHKGILKGRSVKRYKLDNLHDVTVEEGMVWARLIITYKQSNNALESGIVIGRLHKDAVPALQNFFAHYSNAHFTKDFEKDHDELAGTNSNVVNSITESAKPAFIRETPRSGLFESLSVNEAMNTIKDGGEYNPDRCLANAIMYVTITEAMDELGLMNVTDKEYANIIQSANGNVLKESRKAEKVESLNETVICAQEAPRGNVSLSDNDFAERIRQRKLAKENQVLMEETLNEGERKNLRNFFLKVMPNFALNKILTKTKIKVSSMKGSDKYVKKIDELLQTKDRQAKISWIRSMAEYADDAKKADAEKQLSKVNTKETKQLREAAEAEDAELLNEANSASMKMANASALTGGGGLLAIATAAGTMAATGANPVTAVGAGVGATVVAVIITVFAALLVSGIAHKIAADNDGMD